MAGGKYNVMPESGQDLHGPIGYPLQISRFLLEALRTIAFMSPS